VRTRFLPTAAVVLAAAATCTSAADAGVYAFNAGTGPSGNVWQYTAAADGQLAALAPASAATDGQPNTMAASPDGASLYVATDTPSIDQFSIGAGGVLTPKSPAAVAVPSEVAAIAISPDGASLYAADFTNGGEIEQFSINADGSLVAKPAGPVAANSADAIVISPDGTSLYATQDLSTGGVWQFDIGPGGVLTPKSTPLVIAGSKPFALAASPDGKHVYGVNNSPTGILQFDVGAGGALTPKSPNTAPAAAIIVSVTVAGDGRNLYAAGIDGVERFSIGADGTVAYAGTTLVPAGVTPSDVEIGYLGRTVYATNVSSTGSDAVYQYHAEADGSLTPLPIAAVGAGAHALAAAISPARSPIARFTASSASAGSQTTFDGSGSSAPDGRVARYDWTFGDGTTLADAGPAPSHVYGTAGTYPATLTVTDTNGCSAVLIHSGSRVDCVNATGATRTLMVTIPSAAAPVTYPPPVAVATARVVGAGFELDSKGSRDAGGHIVAVTWRWDGHLLSHARRFHFTPHLTARPRTYTFVLTVTDNHRASDTARVAAKASYREVTTTATIANAALFAFDSATVAEQAGELLQDIARSAHGVVRVDIEGHASADGSAAYNLGLSLQRALAVRRIMHDAGLPARVFHVVAYGETHPLASNATAAGRRQNRVVLIRITVRLADRDPILQARRP
jgi:outer membrane protein OmpA-like peptidoglycan-associated protein/sugar lactone lactonase YvrE